MGFNVGDKVKRDGNSIVWTIMEEDSISAKSRLEADFGHGLISSQWVDWLDLLKNYTFVMNSNGKDDSDDQLDWFSGLISLPEGLSIDLDKLKTQEECYHDFQKYTGLRESYEFCTKCNIKRPWEP
jgi:hypothetical protein